MITPVRKEPHTALDGPQYYRLLLRHGLGTFQPLDADLTAISALTTTSFGRGFLSQGDATSARSYIGAGASSFSGAFADLSGKPTTIAGYGITDFNSLGDARWQGLDSDLTALAALATTSFGRDFNTLSDAAAGRTYLGLGTLATQNGTFSGTSSGTNTGDQTITLTGDVTGSGTGSFAATIANSAVTFAKIQDIAGLSVIGRSSNTSGVGAAITGTTDQVLRVHPSGANVAFGTVAAGGLASDSVTTIKILNANVTLAKLADLAGLSIIGRSANTTGASAAITGTDGQALRISGTTLGFGTIVAAGIASDAVTTAKILDANVTIAKLGGLGTNIATFLAATKPTTIAGYGITDFNSLGDARWQTLDSDLTAIAALTTTSFGRGFLTLADAAASRTYIGAGTSSFSGAFSALSGIPTTIAGYGITDYNSLGDARWQTLDADLTSLAAASNPHAIYLRSAANMWSPVVMGPGIYLRGNVLTTISNVAPARITPDDTVASAGTLDLTGLDGSVFEVTGTTDITAITGLADGEMVRLKFTGAGLNLIHDAGVLELLGGVDRVVTTDSVAVLLGGPAGLVTVTEYQNAEAYKSDTFDTLFINNAGQIKSSGTSGYIDLQKGDIGASGNYIRMGNVSGDTYVYLVNNTFSPTGVKLDTSLVAGIGISTFKFPNPVGIATFATISEPQSLTNKKLGDLTTNGFVKTSAGDGTLSVDTATYLTSAAIGSTIQAYDADLTTWAGVTPASGIATFLATPSSANLRSAMTDESGSGALLFASGALGTPASGNLSNCTAYPYGSLTGAPTVLTIGTADVVQKSDGTNLVDTQITSTPEGFTGSLITVGAGSSATITVNTDVSQIFIESTDISIDGLLFVDFADHGRLYSRALNGTGDAVMTTGALLDSASIQDCTLTGHLTITDSINIVLGTSAGSKIGTATSQKLGFHNAAPVVQRAGAAQVAVSTAGATNVTPYGFGSAAQANSIVTLVNEIRAALVEKGLIKGAS